MPLPYPEHRPGETQAERQQRLEAWYRSIEEESNANASAGSSPQAEVPKPEPQPNPADPRSGGPAHQSATANPQTNAPELDRLLGEASQKAGALTPGANSGASGQPAPKGEKPWWEQNLPSTDYESRGGPGWGGPDDMAQYDQWQQGEIKNFANHWQDALKKAYEAGDESLFNQVKKEARADTYGKLSPTTSATPATPATPAGAPPSVPGAAKPAIPDGGPDHQSQAMSPQGRGTLSEAIRKLGMSAQDEQNVTSWGAETAQQWQDAVLGGDHEKAKKLAEAAWKNKGGR